MNIFFSKKGFSIRPDFAVSFSAIILAGLFFAGTAFGWVNPPSGTSAGEAPPPLAVTALGNVGIGTLTPASRIGVAGGVSIGSGFEGTAAPSDSPLIVQNKLGIGSSAQVPNSTLSIIGSVLVGYESFIHVQISANNIAVERLIGIGTTTPKAQVDIDGGGVRIGETLMQGKWNSRIPLPNFVTSIASNNIFNPSISIGRDGAPLVAYEDRNNGSQPQVKLLKCKKLDCSDFLPVVSVSGKFPSLAISSNGFPIVAFWDNGDNKIKLLRCNNDACDSPNMATVVLGPTNVLQTAITINTSGNPLIAYKTGTGNTGTFNLARCEDPQCESAATLVLFDSECTANCTAAGLALNIAVGIDGIPIIAYSRGTTGFYFRKCIDELCSYFNSSNPRITISSDHLPPTRPSIVIERDGFPFLSANYGNFSTGFKCSSLDCASVSIVYGSKGLAAALGADDRVVLAAIKELSGIPYFGIVKCRNAGCRAPSDIGSNIGNSWYSIESAVSFPSTASASIAIGVDGLPIAAYTTESNQLKILKCGSDRCVPYWTRR